MADRKQLSSEEISAIVDSFDPIDVEEMELMAKLPPDTGYRDSEELAITLK